MVFHNEIFSTLLRCVHSVYNRSPKNILHEIILINDNSTFTELYEPLRNYVNESFREKVKIFENFGRQGLIKARMTGAKIATGEVIIFLDSHMEVYNSWLPPLLGKFVSICYLHFMTCAFRPPRDKSKNRYSSCWRRN